MTTDRDMVDARKDVTPELREKINQLELELQAAALLLATARGDSKEDASHVARREFVVVARRVRQGNIPAQSQASLHDQLRELVHHANRAGLYDAADWIGTVIGER